MARIIPALADLTQDIAGPVPLELLYAWATSEQDDASADGLLAPFLIHGTVVSTDTSGLSRMTTERDLLDVLCLISEPKQIVHGIGLEIGGRPIGMWVADNTQMFYPQTVPAAAVVDAMWEAEHRIACELPVAVGMCVHKGTFYELGGGLYGTDAHIVETAAEYDAGPEEVLVTEPVRLDCPAEYEFKLRADLHDTVPIHSLVRAAGMRHLDVERLPFPHPYPQPFFDRLQVFKRAAQRDPLRQEIYGAYLRESVIVFLARAHDASAGWDGAGLLDDLVANVLLDALVSGLDGISGHIAALGGGLGILNFNTATEAIDAAQALQRRFQANSVNVKIGVASGPVLFFSNPRGPSGIAGKPVNVASKISEDRGLVGRINIAADVAAQLPAVEGDPFEIALGGVVLRGITLKPA